MRWWKGKLWDRCLFTAFLLTSFMMGYPQNFFLVMLPWNISNIKALFYFISSNLASSRGCFSNDRSYLTGGGWTENITLDMKSSFFVLFCFELLKTRLNTRPSPLWGFPGFTIVEWLMIPGEVTINFIVFHGLNTNEMYPFELTFVLILRVLFT